MFTSIVLEAISLSGTRSRFDPRRPEIRQMSKLCRVIC